MKEQLTKDITREVITADEINLNNPEDLVADFISRMAEAVSLRKEQLKNTRKAIKILKDPNFSQAVFYKNEQGKIVGFKVVPDNKN